MREPQNTRHTITVKRLKWFFRHSVKVTKETEVYIMAPGLGTFRLRDDMTLVISSKNYDRDTTPRKTKRATSKRLTKRDSSSN